MIISKLPDPQSDRSDGSTEASNAILYASTTEKYYYPAHATPYLVAINFLNNGNYNINNKPATISDKCFYFLNPGDQLAIKFNQNVPLKTMFLFFNEQFVDNAMASILNTDERLLDNPIATAKHKLSIPNVPFQSDAVRSHLNALLSPRLSFEEMDQHLFDFLSSFVKLNNDVSSELKKIGSAKQSTREELYKRLFVAREFMEDNFLSPITIDDIAATACMNKFHFLANFKNLFGTTPHQYLTELKLQKAYQLLQTRQNSVSGVCYSIGFESLPTFSSLFKRRFGVSPSSFLGNR